MNFLEMIFWAALPSAIQGMPVSENFDLETRQTYNPELSFNAFTTANPKCNSGGTGNVDYENEACSQVNPITAQSFLYYSKDFAKHGCTAYLYANLATCTADVGHTNAIASIGPSTPSNKCMKAPSAFSYFAVAGCTCDGC